MLNRREFVQENDFVLVSEPTTGTLRIVQALSRGSFSCKDGDFHNKELIGKRYGSKVASLKRNGHVWILHPTAYLWPSVVDFRTQILFQPDISLIQYFLDLKPGSVVIESGTGSGVLTTSLARCVAPFGHVHTFEFHPERAQKAYNDFKNNGLLDVVTVRQRDIIENGFPYFPQGVDAAFLDLPSPAEVLVSVDKSLRPQGRVCNFSPCIEQVQRVCIKLKELGYEDIITVEILAREYELTKHVKANTMQFNQGVLSGGIVSVNGTYPLLSANEYTVGLHSYQSHKENERKNNNNARKQKAKEQKKAAVASAATTTAPVMTETTTFTESLTENAEHLDKKQKTDDNVDAQELCALPPPTADLKVPLTTQNLMPRPQYNETNLTRPLPIMRGHTGYLTFARKRSDKRLPGVAYATPLSQAIVEIAQEEQATTTMKD